MNTQPIHQIPAGQALLICGHQGTGKTQLAKAIAQQYGPFQVTYPDVIGTTAAIERAMREGIKTLIVDECTPEYIRAGLAVHLKALITTKKVPFKADGRTVTMQAPPRFIFCTGHIQPLHQTTLDRRFYVVDMTHH